MKKNFVKSQSGFTLIELMVALVLGLIIIGAALQLFMGGILSSRLQKANAEIQDSGVFGLDYVVKDIRFANQDNLANLKLNDETPYGGIILTSTTATNTTKANFIPKVSATAYVDSALLSRGQGDTVSTTANYWKGLTRVTLNGITDPVSDQLTIQFVAPENMANCEGANVLAGDLVVQRYFLRPDSNGATTDYALACDANIPSATAATATSTPTIVSGLGDAGQIVIPRVDHFHVLIGARNAAGNFAYYTIPQYRTAADDARASTPAIDPPRILSIQLSILVRSANNAQNNAIDPTQSFVMLDQVATPLDSTTRYQRRVYGTTVALRNAMGDTL